MVRLLSPITHPRLPPGKFENISRKRLFNFRVKNPLVENFLANEGKRSNFSNKKGNSHNSNFVLKISTKPCIFNLQIPDFYQVAVFFFLKLEYVLSTYMKILHSTAGTHLLPSGTYPTFTNNHHHALAGHQQH